VITCYVLGGTGTIRVPVASAIADALRERQRE
jgi:hypothetical protein